MGFDVPGILMGDQELAVAQMDEMFTIQTPSDVGNDEGKND
jgi:hypothetical protein